MWFTRTNYKVNLSCIQEKTVWIRFTQKNLNYCIYLNLNDDMNLDEQLFTTVSEVSTYYVDFVGAYLQTVIF